MIRELAFRFVVGGVLVASFALLGDLFSPKSFAGLFAGAPSIAVGSLALSVAKEGALYEIVEARSWLTLIAATVAWCAVAALAWILRKAR